MPFSTWGGVGLASNHVLDGGPEHSPKGNGQFWGISSPLNSIADAAQFVAIRNDQHLQVRSQGTQSRGGHRLAYSTRRCGILSIYFDLLFFWRLFTAITFGCDIFTDRISESGNAVTTVRPFPP